MAADLQPPDAVTVETERLLLRPWCDEDLAPFAAMSADPDVMQFLGPVMTRAESDALVARLQAHIDERGYGFWAVEAVGVAPLIGFVGLVHPGWEAHFTPCVEIGWRLARAHWGQGYATEAALGALAFGFGELGLREIVALTVPANVRSRRVMERIGMVRDPMDDFDHPRVPPDSPLRRHVLYRRNVGPRIDRAGRGGAPG